MVFTRGRQSTEEADATSSTRHWSHLATDSPVRSRKRRRSISDNHDSTPLQPNYPNSASPVVTQSIPLQSSLSDGNASANNDVGHPQVDTSINAAREEDNDTQLASQLAQELLQNGMNGVMSEYNASTTSGYHPQYYDHLAMAGPSGLLPDAANKETKIQSLPMLDNLAVQILNIIAKSSYQEVVHMAMKRETEAGRNYETLKDLFNHAKRVYSESEPFLNARQMGFFVGSHIETIRKANMATFIISILGSQDVGFYHLNEYFIDTFVAEGQQLEKKHADLLLELKTQAYISAISNGDRSREEILYDLFPENMEERLASRRPGGKKLTPNEREFLIHASNRRKGLLDEPDTPEAVKQLPEKYIWAKFLRDVSGYIVKTYSAVSPDQDQNDSILPKPAPFAPPVSSAQSQSQQTPQSNDDIAGKAQRAAQFAMQDYGSGQNPSGDDQTTRNTSTAAQSMPTQALGPEIQFHFENKLHPNVPGPQLTSYYNAVTGHYGPMYDHWGAPLNDPNYVPYPTQSAPTQVLYERARMVASAKSQSSVRKPGQPNQRHPWTLEEENTLMAGLDRVKGPHWSQILAMFGRGGTISEILKDRGQVQLKDKARNLKLFFLKNNIEVPYYLQFVTGEMKTRAPSQAAKQEAKKKATSEEDRARTEGILALAAGPSRGESSTSTSTKELPSRPNEALEKPPTNHENPNEGNLDPHISSPTPITAGRPNFAPIPDMMSGRKSEPQLSSQHPNKAFPSQPPPTFSASSPHGISPAGQARPGIPM
ncbi:uncharacterized protein KY384_007905 [Bacidia gigantensis]|uniref:uncharacterized protein n=1 Tax=Bacidia gigantensis TaxID=2732470 RepID=UPI001D05BA93|nr:uncharacterized protein KY384_007905 [Bacidia gigantensis]KAG8527751.1 hypothetical protein KY384_007905 [Bacidia gigantensis]